MDELVRLLDERNLAEASDRQKALLRDLNAVLRLLLEDAADLEEKRKEVELLQALRDRVAGLLAEQQRHRASADEVARREALLRQVEAAARQTEALIRRETAAIERTDAARRQVRPEASDLAGEQARIRDDTDRLADDVHRLAEAATTQPAGTQPAAASQPADSARLAEARDEIRRAAARMKDAEPPLGQGRLDPARASQERSVESLRAALQALQREADDLRRRLDAAKLADAQRQTAEKAKGLAGHMSGKPAPGGPQEGKPADPPTPPTPGQEDVDKARREMEGAARDLERDRPAEAVPQQQKAVEHLVRAKEQLEETLNQLRREQQEEVLRAMEDRFRDMLARQVRINQGTDDLDRKGAAKWSRADELLAGTLAQGERDLAGEATQALGILRQEGSTLVFPQIVEQLAADFTAVADRIAARSVGPATRQLQADIVETLKELIDAVQQMRKQGPPGMARGGDAGGQSQLPPLLPNSAELKLLRACQVRVNRQTDEFIRDRGADRDLTPEQRAWLQRIADRQREVAAMAQELAERSQQ